MSGGVYSLLFTDGGGGGGSGPGGRTVVGQLKPGHHHLSEEELKQKAEAAMEAQLRTRQAPTKADLSVDGPLFSRSNPEFRKYRVKGVL